MKTIHVTIDARKWFDKTYGNTYHKVYLTLIKEDGSFEQINSDMEYGYGEQWNQTALDLWFKHHGTARTRYDHAYLTSYLRNSENILHTTTVRDVQRKKDL